MRGEGNHKIPGSFAPENMEKTGAERVKYSLACQHEDAIPIKFVSYAQKCPTVLCTFAVALRKESVDRNFQSLSPGHTGAAVALRKESVDRNAAWTGVLRDMHHALHLDDVDGGDLVHVSALDGESAAGAAAWAWDWYAGPKLYIGGVHCE